MAHRVWLLALLGLLIGEPAGLTTWSASALEPLALVQEPRRKVALVVGVERYDKPGFNPLDYAEDDVEAVGQRLAKLGFRVTTLKGSGRGSARATKRTIESTLERLVSPLGVDDLILVMFSGHGMQTSAGDAYFCPVDAVENRASSMVSLSYVIRDVLKPNVGKRILLIDACRNDPDPGKGKDLGGIQGRYIELPEDTAVLFSCRAGQRSFESAELKQGIFTHCVLEALDGKDGVGALSWSELAGYVKRRMASREIRGYIPRGNRQDPIPADLLSFTTLGVIPDRSPPAPRRSFAERLGIVLVSIPSGSFFMGSTDAEIDRILELYPDAKRSFLTDEQPRHRVRISRPFFLGRHEVTVGQFRAFVDATGYRTDAEKDGKGGFGWNESAGKFEQDPRYSWRDPGFSQSDVHPVSNVSWRDAEAFCAWLSEEDDRYTFRLPTEAEWEYAARGGTTTLWPEGDDPESLARHGNVADATAKRKHAGWTTISSDDGYLYTAPVGRYVANGFGLQDMLGNVWEWCSDGYASGYYGDSPGSDPQGSPGASYRVIRGGSWGDDPQACRAAVRLCNSPEFRSNDLGFRPVAVPSGG